MFGYLLANLDIMSKDEKKLYKSQYCGLCQELASSYGNVGRATLTYDLTFVNMILSDINSALQKEETITCPIHPLKKQNVISNEFTNYCADMNIYLTYYKYLDDIYDEKSQKAKRKSEKLQPYLSNIESKYPHITSIIKKQLAQINAIEKENILNPDPGSNAFGIIMGELLSNQSAKEKDNLFAFGYHLGRFIYVMDAVIDIKQDIKKQCYNPLVSLENIDFQDMLMMIMEDADSAYQHLSLNQNKAIIDNIIYSGIWSKYQIAQKKGNI